jgi:RNA polymerase sigma-70 factor (ECF subfamily)
MGSADESALVKRACAGDRAAFEELVRQTTSLVYSRLFLETGDRHRAEDLLQETMLLAYRSIHRLTDASAFRPWLLTIARRALLDGVRAEGRQRRRAPLALHAPVEEAAAPGLGPMGQVERQEERQRLLAILRSLPEAYRLPLTLRYIGGADHDTIAQQLGLTNGALRGFLHRGLKLMRERLGNLPGWGDLGA